MQAVENPAPAGFPVWVEILPGLWEGHLSTLEEINDLDIRTRLSGLPPVTRDTLRFSSWKHYPEFEEAYRSVYSYASGRGKHPFLTLVGPPGTGKTHLAAAVAWTWLEYLRRSVKYYQVETLLDTLRRSYNKKDPEADEDAETILNYMQKCRLTILDDMGSEAVTEWAWSKLFSIVDYRYIHKLPLIVTTNVAPDKLHKRIADRLMEGQVVILKGESYRKRIHEATVGA